jgi:ABC-type Mn2+/Zn2+ transport system permease subunit
MPAPVTPTAMLNLITAPLSEDFFLRALVAILLCGVSAACLGTYIVVRRMAFISTALTHSILPGIVAAALLGLSLYVGALVAALLTAAGVAWISGRKGNSEDSAIGVMLSVMFALGIALMSVGQTWRDFTGLLFGSIVSVGMADLILIALTSFTVLLILRVLHKELELASFDEEYALLIGAKPSVLRMALLVLIALAAVASVRLVGALLTTALFVIPSATGIRLGKSLAQAMAWSALCAVLGGVSGLYLSYYISGMPSGAAIVLCCATPYFLVRILK